MTTEPDDGESDGHDDGCHAGDEDSVGEEHGAEVVVFGAVGAEVVDDGVHVAGEDDLVEFGREGVGVGCFFGFGGR